MLQQLADCTVFVSWDIEVHTTCAQRAFRDSRSCGQRFGCVEACVGVGLELAKFNGNGFEDFGFQELDLAGAIAAEDHEQHDSRLDVVNGAVWSRFFWGYLVGISGLASAPLGLSLEWELSLSLATTPFSARPC